MGTAPGLQHAAERWLRDWSWKLLSCGLRAVGSGSLCTPQARCSLSHARDLLATAVRHGQEALRGQLSLELLDSGQKQREGRPRLVLLQSEAQDPWEGAAGQGDTELSLCTKTIHYTSQETR